MTKSISTSGGIAAMKAQATATKAASTVGVLINTADVKERFQKMLGKKSDAFLSSLLTLTNQNSLLQKCAPATVLSAAAIAASLELPINQSLGMAWIIPYGDKAQFQLGVKGLIQLAMRSGQMKSIVATEVYEGEISQWNRFTETFTPGEKVSDKVIGYYAAFELINGFKKATFWSVERVTAHAKRFSKTFNNGPWRTDFDAMAKKTVLKSILSGFAPMSTQMQEAMTAEAEEPAMVNANEPAEQIETVDVVATAPAFEEVPNDGELTAKEQQEILDAMGDK